MKSKLDLVLLKETLKGEESVTATGVRRWKVVVVVAAVGEEGSPRVLVVTRTKKLAIR